MQIALVVLYPLLVHLSILLGLPLLLVLALWSLAVGLFYQGLKKRDRFSWIFISIFTLALIPFAVFDIALYLLYVPPIVLPLLLAVVFASTLLPGKEALVTAIGEAAKGPLGNDMRRYTKGVTILWAVFCFAMMIEDIVLAVFASEHLWSWMTSIVNYLMIAVLFLGEFYYRKWRFPQYEHPNLIDYIKIVIHANITKR